MKRCRKVRNIHRSQPANSSIILMRAGAFAAAKYRLQRVISTFADIDFNCSGSSPVNCLRI